MQKMPPIEKIYEAYTAIVDGRVTMFEKDSSAKVISSNGAKNYTVQWAGKVYRADDNATFWQGYAGYPVLAVLMLQGALPYSRGTAAAFAGLQWNKLNTAAGRNYAKAAEMAFEQMGCTATQKTLFETEAQKALETLAALDIETKRLQTRQAKK